MNSLSHVRLLATPWTAAHQAPPPMGSSRQEYCGVQWGAIAFSYATFKVFATLKKSLTYEADRLDRSLKLTHSILIVLCICIFIPLFVIVYCIPRQKCSEIIDRFSVGRKIDKPKHIHISECTGEEGSWRSRT